jgi:septum formation protein
MDGDAGRRHGSGARYARVMPELVLASTSRHRRRLLERLGLPFDAVAPACDEETEKARGPKEPLALAAHLARAKATSLRATHPGRFLLGGDQLATVDGSILDKPGTETRARAQLARLAGRAHRLVTALCLVHPDGTLDEHVDVCALAMRPLDEGEIARYVARERPLDCCGSYRVERLGIALFESIEAPDFTAIEGLPLMRLAAMLRQAGFEIP